MSALSLFVTSVTRVGLGMGRDTTWLDSGSDDKDLEGV